VDTGDWILAAKEIKRWNKAGVKVLPGLTARREDEVKLLVSDHAQASIRNFDASIKVNAGSGENTRCRYR
jgi:hypothetical protein